MARASRGAREDLGYVREGETVLKFPKTDALR